MDCPRCQARSKVLESRGAEEGAAIRRRRRCPACGHRFTTFERRASEPLHVRKRTGERQRFDRTKLRAALLRSTHKRQVGAEEVEALVDRIEVAIAAAGGELDAARIGELSLAGLRDLDYGAYLQFLGTLPAPAPDAGRPNAEFADSPGGGSVRPARKSSSLPAETG